MPAEILCHSPAAQVFKAWVCTIEAMQEAPHFRDGLVVVLARPNAKGPSNILHNLEQLAVSSPIRAGRPIENPPCPPLEQEHVQLLMDRRRNLPSLPVNKLS